MACPDVRYERYLCGFAYQISLAVCMAVVVVVANSPKKVAQLVRDKRIGTRGHLVFDWVAVIAILAMTAFTLIAGWSESISCCAWDDPLHPYALLLLNAIGMLLVILAMNAYQTNKGGIRALWRKGEHTRPAEESDASNQGIASQGTNPVKVRGVEG